MCDCLPGMWCECLQQPDCDGECVTVRPLRHGFLKWLRGPWKAAFLGIQVEYGWWEIIFLFFTGAMLTVVAIGGRR